MKKITLLLFTFFLVNTITAQYLVEDFEGGTTIPPAGWIHNQTNTNETWTISNTTSVSGTNSAEVLYDAALGVQDEQLVSPSIDLTAASSPQLRFQVNLSYFWSISPNNNYDAKVYVDNGSGNTLVWEEADLGEFESFSWIEVVVDLSAYVGDSITVTFAYEGADGASLNIDDIIVEETATCPDPDLTFDDFTNSTVDISMDSSADYDIEWGEFPYVQGDGGSSVSISGADSYQISGLSPGVSYNVFVRKNCGGGDFSDYQLIEVGTTINPVDDYPFSEGFEPDPNQILVLNLGISFAGEGSWNLNIDDPNDTTEDFAFDGLSCFFSNNTFVDANADAIMYIGPFNMVSNEDYTISFQQRNLDVSSSTRPNKDMQLVVTQTPDGTDDTVVASFIDMDNNTYQERSGVYTPSETGEFYIGFHDISNFLATATEGNSVFVDDLQVSSTLGVQEFNAVELDYFVNDQNMLNLSSRQSLEGISIHNLLGQQVLNQKLNAQEEIIDLNALTSGVYLARVQVNGTSKTFKIMKK